jgi:hypothetical protein
MMNEKDKTDQINERMMEDQGLRGLGGTKTVVSYTDLVLNAYTCVKDIGDDNGVEFDTNLYLFIEGLIEDINECEAGREVRHLPIRPKTTQDVDE